MNSNPHNAMSSDSGRDCGEATLRLIAGLPAPAGLEERVHKALGEAPRGGRVLAWPARFRARAALESNWVRATAAAAIVFVVVGGGWGVYSRVQPGLAGKVIVMPAREPSSGGFGGPKVREQGSEGAREQGNAPKMARKPVVETTRKTATPAAGSVTKTPN
jgi:hypothetical protein